MAIVFDLPNTQVGFANTLKELRETFLQDALATTVAVMEINILDSELHEYVDNGSLQTLATHGMRGELFVCGSKYFGKEP